MMDQAIRNFHKQFEFDPAIVHEDALARKEKIIVSGMGGSHLSADILKDTKPELRICVHHDYGLPAWKEEELRNSLVIASSYSGNTEEVIDGYQKARQKGLSMAVIAVGGKLIKMAQKDSVPYVQMPDTGIQPRSALGFSFLALLKIAGQDRLLWEAQKLAAQLRPDTLEDKGKKLAKKLDDRIPVVYASARNYSLAYNWKIKFNETGKIPAFYNVFSELNHNEMTGFDVKDSSQHLSERFYFIFIKDAEDHPGILKRMKVLERMYHDRGLLVSVEELAGASRMERIFSSLILADWTAFFVAQQYGLESEHVPMVEEFKRLIT